MLTRPEPTEREPLTRIQDNILARSERRLLNHFCAQMPRWVTPDKLTSLGVAGALVTFAGYVLSNLAPAFLPSSAMAFNGSAIRWTAVSPVSARSSAHGSVISSTIAAMA
jgi:hypothetical protein